MFWVEADAKNRESYLTEPCRDLGLIYAWIINPGITHLQVLQDEDLYDG